MTTNEKIIKKLELIKSNLLKFICLLKKLYVLIPVEGLNPSNEFLKSS